MSDQHLHRAPTFLKQSKEGLEVWIYEEGDGIRIFDDRGYVGLIPWRLIKGALDRKLRAPQKRERTEEQ